MSGPAPSAVRGERTELSNRAAPAPLPNDPAEVERLARLGLLATQWMAEREALAAESKRARKVKPEGPKAGDVFAARDRLGQVVLTLVSVHRVAWQATCLDSDDKEAALTLITETVRGTVRALNACRLKLGDGTAGGYFEDDMRDGP